jgi:hypothetical protein
MGIAAIPRSIPWKGARLGHRRDLDNPIWSKVFRKKEVEGAASIHQHFVELDVFYDGADYEGTPPRLWYKVQVVAVVESNGDLRPSMVLGGGGTDRKTSRTVSFCFLLASYEWRPPKI